MIITLSLLMSLTTGLSADEFPQEFFVSATKLAKKNKSAPPGECGEPGWGDVSKTCVVWCGPLKCVIDLEDADSCNKFQSNKETPTKCKKKKNGVYKCKIGKETKQKDLTCKPENEVLP